MQAQSQEMRDEPILFFWSCFWQLRKLKRDCVWLPGVKGCHSIRPPPLSVHPRKTTALVCFTEKKPIFLLAESSCPFSSSYKPLSLRLKGFAALRKSPRQPCSYRGWAECQGTGEPHLTCRASGVWFQGRGINESSDPNSDVYLHHGWEAVNRAGFMDLGFIECVSMEGTFYPF